MALHSFSGGPLHGSYENVDAPALDMTGRAPDSVTIEIPGGLLLSQAVRLNQVRVIEEPKANVLASRPGQVLRYRNGAEPNTWAYVAHQ